MLLVLLWSATAVAQIYKWTDENGVVHYGDKKPPTNRGYLELKPKPLSGVDHTPTNRLDRALKTYKATGIDPNARQPRRNGNAKLQIDDWHNRLSPSGRYKYVEGTVSNISGVPADNVRVKVLAMDDNKKLVSLTEGNVDPRRLRPSREGTFKVSVPNHSAIDKFQLKVLWE